MNSKLGVVSLVVAILLALGLGFFVWQNNQLKAEIEILQDTVAVNQVEKAKLLSNLDSLEVEIKKQVAANEEMDSVLAERLAEIEQTRAELAVAKADAALVAKYKKQIEILRATAEQFIRENDMLKHKVDSLGFEDSLKKRKIDTMTIIDFQKTQQIEKLSEKVELGSQLRISDIIARGYNKSGKIATKARRTAKIGVAGTLLKNSLAESGSKTLFIRIISPSGTVLTASNANQFDFEGKTIMYTEKKELGYNNEDVKFEIFYDASNETLEVGNYMISIFCGGKEIGRSSLGLQ
ncbi:MAG: hypothetical protein MJ198_06680 [Bacteroidales bacterium]|nr:hypothetical protein [Bacteroidales bacterium]